MFSISSATGSVRIKRDAKSETTGADARISRRATLDGGTVFNHYGVSHSDRQMTLRGRITAEETDALMEIFTTQTAVFLAARDGFFEGMIKSVQADNGDLRLVFWVKEKLA